MSDTEYFDTLILGSGQGGKLLAWHLARSGQRVAVVERRWVGGACPAVACLPSKNELWSARVAHMVQRAAEFGTVTGPVKTDMTRVRGRKQEMVDREIVFHLGAYEESGAELIMGEGRFVATKTIEVQLNDGGSRRLSGDHVVVNVGSHAAIPDIPGLEAARSLTHIEALELDYLPSHLIVLGGGYVGIEMAQAYRRFGSRVTIIEPGARLMGREDPDVADEMQRILDAEGIEILLDARPVQVQGLSGDAVTVAVRTATGEQAVDGSDLLVAVGRVANTADIGLETTGVERDARGFIQVNERLETTAAGIWAIGECAGSPQFTHVSVDDFRIVRDNMAGGNRRTDDRQVPYVMFTDPPLARVGLSEGEAQRQGIEFRLATLPMSKVLRTEATDETQGFMKVLVAADDDRILGFTMIGSEAGEVMAVVQTAMLAGLAYHKLRDAVIVHLTIAEGLGPLFANVPPGS
ncbi:pyruvate/2-oxoglutarate dehydrogenase complex dihydrolipoamide dehydrogenase (E3) component [Phyllobacterium trifolii]|uniref:Pyruvate/2-oxoglutarate dehydrogenase complex dihydrolipoamide dehydrogenase (E3) component n=1 Tax=Phyllobacterium trifolii TaxID=300193 RepID=A0A839UHG6_9HYPH|nr:FAD-dependent oxidoreductase [Phyllobacterium trifolii]MBB3149254.1 pyruvate/2-oxoglutarate dehydrogenase complex dihydrolipoamide dehydrogenase (E3) component [Phyllobacterium trifolii]